MPIHGQPKAVTIRVVHGDIADAQASMIVVNHLNGLPPAGATAAIDEVLGGAIMDRASAGALRGRFGTSWFIPSFAAPLAAGCVVVILLGDPEYFNEERLPETGEAIVDAARLIGVRDAATVLHGGGGLHVPPQVAAKRMVSGVLEGLARTGAQLRELSIVELDEEKLPAIRRGVQEAASQVGAHVYLEGGKLIPRRKAVRVQPVDTAIPPHLRLGITRHGSKLKVTTVGTGSVTSASDRLSYPAGVADDILDRLKAALEKDGDRTQSLKSIGTQLYNTFLGDLPELELKRQLAEAPNRLVVLGLDRETVDLPWELLCSDDKFLAATHRIGRHVELPYVGRQSAHPAPSELRQVLVIGDPQGDLGEARAEAREVAAALRAQHRVTVTPLIFNGKAINHEDVSNALDSTDFDILHYAGHGEYDPLRENESGLRLADRLLTADDLATRRWVPRLVVANACHAARTGPEGGNPFDGARHTRDVVHKMLGAGTKAFVGAMWRVGDEPAAMFAAAFYDKLLQPNHPTFGEAMRHARNHLMEELPHDPSWAAYALYGNPWGSIFDPSGTRT